MLGSFENQFKIANVIVSAPNLALYACLANVRQVIDAPERE